MQYTLPNKIRTLSIIFVVIGVVSVIFGMIMDPVRAWSSLLFNNFFFLAISVAGTFFVALQYAARSGWATAIKRIPEAMGAYLPVGGLLLLVIFLLGNHSLYHWTHHDLYVEESPHYDAIIAGKHAYLNIPFFLTRMVVFLGIWIIFHHMLRRNSLLEDQTAPGDITYYRKNFRLSAIFLVLFGITSSIAAWDWLMSIDTHWFSTLFGWYVFSGLFVSGLVTITLIIIYLKKNGYLPEVNENHLHDLGKFVFAFSIFWTYLWISQFLLIWYSNIPEEITYYIDRFDHFRVLFLTTFFINFIMPVFILMTRNSKRRTNTLVFICVVLIIGHWMDVAIMVLPGTVGESASIGFVEIGVFAGFLGLFVFTVLTALSRAPLVAQNHPFLKESLHHHT